MNIEFFVVLYFDGDFVIIDFFSDYEIERKWVSCYILSVSVDGWFFVGGGGGGVI